MRTSDYLSLLLGPPADIVYDSKLLVCDGAVVGD